MKEFQWTNLPRSKLIPHGASSN